VGSEGADEIDPAVQPAQPPSHDAVAYPSAADSRCSELRLRDDAVLARGEGEHRGLASDHFVDLDRPHAASIDETHA